MNTPSGVVSLGLSSTPGALNINTPYGSFGIQ
jgi:hypothetical protein